MPQNRREAHPHLKKVILEDTRMKAQVFKG